MMHNLEMIITMLGGAIVFSLLCGSVVSNKVCTNSGVLSNTNRFQLLSLNNSWEKENLTHLHLVHGDDETWSNLIPRKMLKEDDGVSWNIMYREMKNSDGERGVGVHFLKDVPLHDVRLDSDSDYGMAQQTNLEYLLMLNADSLVWSFRKTAGLEALGEAYGGWEAPDVELRGHFVGHYMSASAQMWASTHNATLKEKMSLVVAALSECQIEIATGYLSAFPSELFDRFEALESVWAPYYTIHKILAGLLDQYTFAGNDLALNMTSWMVEYFYNRVQNVISKHTIERHWLSLNEETGGMNDVLYRLHRLTGDEKHLYLAHLFDKPCFLGLLAMKADDISGFHSNTHIPIVIGSQLRYEITGEPLYKEIGSFFMDIVNSSHSYATGGTSVGEFWSDPKRLASTLETENEESCTTYNMLKVSRNLFRWTKEMAYADYYERASINGVLGIQRGKEPGVMIYMLPLHPGGSKARSYHKWGTKFDSFWCCYGTGIESFSKLGDSIYFEDVKDHGLYIIQYVPSSFDWKSGKILLRQTVEPVNSWNNSLKVVITILQNKKAERPSTLNLRIPTWTHSDGSKASFNDQDLSLPAPGSFLSVTKTWTSGDKIILDLPLSLRTEAIKDDRPEYASLRAFLYGPYVLAGFSNGDQDMILEESSTSISDSITPVPSHYNNELVTIKLESNNSEFVLANDNRHIKLIKYPASGTNAAITATFRLIELSDLGVEVMLEPFDYPGFFLIHHGEGENIGVSDRKGSSMSIFRMVKGLNGMFKLESDDQRGCYVYTELPDGNVKLNCSCGSSFVFGDGMKKYHPISFLAKGGTRNFVLSPLNSMLDESYTVYFNTTL